MFIFFLFKHVLIALNLKQAIVLTGELHFSSPFILPDYFIPFPLCSNFQNLLLTTSFSGDDPSFFHHETTGAVNREHLQAPIFIFTYSPASRPIQLAFLNLLMDTLSLPLSKANIFTCALDSGVTPVVFTSLSCSIYFSLSAGSFIIPYKCATISPILERKAIQHTYLYLLPYFYASLHRKIP